VMAEFTISDLRRLEGPTAFHSPCHRTGMNLVRHGQEPMRGETYGIWRCYECGRQWFEDETNDLWVEWSDEW